MRPPFIYRAGVLGLFLSLSVGWVAPSPSNDTTRALGESSRFGPPLKLDPGEPRSNPRELTAVGGKLFFAATTEGQRELWTTDGTPAGTRRVRDVFPGPESSNPQHLAALDGVLLFNARTLGRASDGNIHVLGQELWRSDGSPEGTCLVKDINPGRPPSSESPHGYEYSDSSPTGLKNVGDVVYFRAKGGDSSSTNLEGLWRSDGTPEGTSFIRDLYIRVANQASSTFVAMDGVIYFAANGNFGQSELWRSDGTPEGTWRIAGPPLWRDVSQLKVVDGVLYFMAYQESTGTELWRSDGSLEGTRRVTDINPGPGHSVISCVTSMGGALYFSAYQEGTGSELWRSDGTPEGTWLVKDINPGPEDSGMNCPIVLDGALYFTALEKSTGMELWRSEGTAETTRLFKELVPGTGWGVPWQRLHPLESGGFLFSATAPDTGTELWMSDGTVEGTALVADVFPGAESSNPGDFVRAGNTLYFTAGDSVSRELWALPLPGATPPDEPDTSRSAGPNPCPQEPDAGGAPDGGSAPDAGDLGPGGDEQPPEVHLHPNEVGCGALPSDALPLAGLLVMAVLAKRRGHRPRPKEGTY
ncbi:ELWxxDGT repeat protein [Archangium lipolyticum]|uniref:ELWxxDGT repeat protein n=1 Tax=Archangium lipolyticum TaxID=2970465 RepID=UPI002149FDFC|nr:ELWxxDGT repeat protein [Archangium lipolyticum]